MFEYGEQMPEYNFGHPSLKVTMACRFGRSGTWTPPRPKCYQLLKRSAEAMSTQTDNDGYLEGQLLIAMPAMADPRFARSLIYLCAHSADGAMGLVVNKLLGAMTFPDLLSQLGVEAPDKSADIQIHFGGPVEPGRGFVLHTSEPLREGSLKICDNIALTATIDILKEMAVGGGPPRNLLALGYAGWGPGQLESEIQENAWLNVEPSDDLLFDENIDTKWERAMQKLGVDFSMLSSTAGRA